MALPTVTAVYRLTADPRLRVTTHKNIPVLHMRLVADASRYNQNTGSWDKTAQVFIDAELMDRGARELHRALRKGSLVTVSGELVTDEWRTPQGERRSRIKIQARSVHVCASINQLARRVTPTDAGDEHDPLGDLPDALDRDGH